MKPWHFSVVILSRHLPRYNYLNAPLRLQGSCATRADCVALINAIPYPKLTVKIWLDPYTETDKRITYPQLGA